MRTGWYQRYRDYYARFRSEGMTHDAARNAAIQTLKEEK